MTSSKTRRTLAALRHEDSWPETDEPLPDASDVRTAEGVAYDPSVTPTPVGECEAMDEWREIVARDDDAREVLCPECSRLHGHWSGGVLYLWDHDEGGHVRVEMEGGGHVDARCVCGAEWRIGR